MSTGENYIKQNKFSMPETPDWCPLLKDDILLKKIPSDSELIEFASAVSLSSISNMLNSEPNPEVSDTTDDNSSTGDDKQK